MVFDFLKKKIINFILLIKNSRLFFILRHRPQKNYFQSSSQSRQQYQKWQKKFENIIFDEKINTIKNQPLISLLLSLSSLNKKDLFTTYTSLCDQFYHNFPY